MIESARISGLRPVELAEELGLHPSTVHQFCKSRGLPQLEGGHRDVIERCIARRLPDYFKAAMTEYCEENDMHPRDLIMVSVTEHLIRSGHGNPHRHKPADPVEDPEPTKKKRRGGRRKGPLKPIGEFPLRKCFSMHKCCLCKETINAGELYRDGGYNRRAHENCNPKKGET